MKAISLDIGSPPFEVVRGGSSVERNLGRYNAVRPKSMSDSAKCVECDCCHGTRDSGYLLDFLVYEMPDILVRRQITFN